MNLIADLPFNRHYETIRNATGAIIKRARELFPGRPWSICELRMTVQDVQWLRDWAAALDRQQLKLSLDYSARRPYVGLLLLTLAAESCRRDSRERGIWQVFANANWNEDVQLLLFGDIDYPHKNVRDCLEDACRCFGLRHAFDLQLQDSWYLTAKLQFGFTLHGARDQLALWMVGNPHAAIRQLTEPDGVWRSDSFVELWDTLKKFRSGKIDERRTRTLFSNSPWVLAEWIDDLLGAATKQVNSGYTGYFPDEGQTRSRQDQPDSDRFEVEVEAEESCQVLITQPRLVWRDDSIDFQSRLLFDALEGLRGEIYFLSANDHEIELFRRQQDGTYSGLRGNQTLTISSDSDSVSVVLAEQNGNAVVCQTLGIGDDGSELLVFDSSGRATSIAKMNRELEYTLRLPLQTVVKTCAATQVFDSGKYRWVRVFPGWDESLSIQIPGDSEAMELSSIAEDSARDDWAKSISVTLEQGHGSPQQRRLRVSQIDGMTVESVQIEGRSIEFDRNDIGPVITRPIPRPSMRHDGTFRVRVVVKGHRSRVLYRSLCWESTGMVVQQDGRWKQVAADAVLDRTLLSRKPLAIYPGRTEREEGWTLFESARIVNSRFQRETRLTDLGVRGWPLHVSDHQFNRAAGAKSLKLCGAIVDHGIVADGVQLAGSKLVRLSLLDCIELGDEHHVVLWTESGKLANISFENIVVDGGEWTVDPEKAGIDNDDPVVAAAIAFRGTRLGSWWSDEWWRVLLSVDDSDAAESAATCLRWFRLPLMLCTGSLKAVIDQYGTAFFDQWCLTEHHAEPQAYRRSEQFLPNDLLKQDQQEVGWLETSRLFLRHWNPSGTTLLSLAPFSFQIDDKLTLQDLVEQVTTWNPVLASRIVNAWLEGQVEKTHERWLRERLSQSLREPLEIRRSDWIERHCGEFGNRDHRVPWLALSDAFVEGLIETARIASDGLPIDPIAEENLETAMNKADLCRLIAAELIEKSQCESPIVVRSR